ncbi:MAG: tetratricopeptide repeat protein [Dehalococcoidia bacterium]
MRERAQGWGLERGWRFLLLSLAVMWIALLSTCVSANSPRSALGADEERLLLALDDAGVSGEPVREEAHRYYDEARRMAVRGEWEEAIALYQQAIALEPSYRGAYEGRAEAYHALGRHQEAIGGYSRAIEIREDSHLYTERGHADVETGRHLQADQDYHMALSSGHPSPNAYIVMGDSHRLIGAFKEAIRSYSEAILLDRESWRAYYFRGVCRFKLRQFQQALEDFGRVIALQPHNAGAYFARGAVRWLGGQCADALKDFQTFVAFSADEETLSRARAYIDYLKATVECEPPPDIPLPV